MPATMLLAEDSLTIRRVIELTFANEDVRIVSVGDGESAIQRIDAEPPDIVLADVGMPKLDGYGVATHLKQSAALRHIPVLLLTGAFEPIDEDRARESGCDGILVKPFDPQLLLARVKELLARRPRSRAPEHAPLPVPAPPEATPVVTPELETVTYSFGIHTPEPPPVSPLAQSSSIPQADVPMAAIPAFVPFDVTAGAPVGTPPELLELADDVEEVLELGPLPTSSADDGGLEMEFDQIEAAFEERHPHDLSAPSGTDTLLGAVLDPGVWGHRMGLIAQLDPVPTVERSDTADEPRLSPHPETAEDLAAQSSAASTEHLDRVIDDPDPAVVFDREPAPAALDVVDVAEAPPSSWLETPPALSETPAPESPIEPPTEHVVAAAETRSAMVPIRAARMTSRVSLANAFSVLLAAEQPPPPVASPPTAPAVSEAMVEELVRRVLTRMSEETVHRIVADTAGRVIREEIDRIKNDPRS